MGLTENLHCASSRSDRDDVSAKVGYGRKDAKDASAQRRNNARAQQKQKSARLEPDAFPNT
jgi:hypothetical protein